MRAISSLLLALFCGLTLSAFAGEPVKLPPQEKFYLFLLAGQSNMAGRGIVEAQDKTVPVNVLTLDKNGQWQPAVDPIHFDKAGVGVGPGRTFGILAAAHYPGVTIGLIPSACGGSSISSWVPGGYHDQTKSHPYDDAIKRTKLAMQQGVLKGIIWHQGESDCNAKAAAVYADNLKTLIQRFRTEFNAPDVPVVIGQLGQFHPWNQTTKQIDAAHRQVAAEVPRSIFVKSDGFTCNKDQIHFDARSEREFGKRYFAAYLELTEKK